MQWDKAHTKNVDMYVTHADGPVMKLALASHTDVTSAIAWSPNNGNRLVSCAYDGTVKLWDIRSNIPLHTLSGIVVSRIKTFMIILHIHPKIVTVFALSITLSFTRSLESTPNTADHWSS